MLPRSEVDVGLLEDATRRGALRVDLPYLYPTLHACQYPLQAVLKGCDRAIHLNFC